MVGGGDHPRSRGVYCSTSDTIRLKPGSSPLARGLPIDPHLFRREAGIIPARAGFTMTKILAYDPGVGSSPLARGLRPHHLRPGRLGRIIPARAGFTWPWSFATPSPTDHPRSRGVYDRRHSVLVTTAGSSPLARGLPKNENRGLPGDGIIPARAGFTRPD